MKQGRVLKIRPGRDANCSSEAYIGVVLVSYTAYAVLFLVLLLAEGTLSIRRWGERLSKVRMWVWVAPQALAVAVLLGFGYYSGAMDYASGLFIWFLVGLAMAAIGIGWGLLGLLGKKEGGG